MLLLVHSFHNPLATTPIWNWSVSYQNVSSTLMIHISGVHKFRTPCRSDD